MDDLQRILIDENLTEAQKQAVMCDKRRLLIIAGAGSGKTEVMARRIAWWVGMENVEKHSIVAFTFTERAAEEMKFRIRSWLDKITPQGEEVTLGGMYVGTIHGFCLQKLREFWPDDYHNYDVLDESARAALILRGYFGLLGLSSLQSTMNKGQYDTIETFCRAYDLLHEYNYFDVELPPSDPPYELGAAEQEWCKAAKLITDVGSTQEAKAFALAAGRYYAYLRCRHFLDFSTSQSEFIRRLHKDLTVREEHLKKQNIHLVVDEIQDINPIQKELIDLLIAENGKLTAVGDHRQAIYSFRGAKIEIVGHLWEEFRVATDAAVIDLEDNFRSTPRIIDLANRWSDTIGTIRSMALTPMRHGNKRREDHHKSHVALVHFPSRDQEALWISQAIRILVPERNDDGARHDKRDGSHRGLNLSDIAILVRSSTDVRKYMQALEQANIPCIVRAGPDLFSQPEILLFISALAIVAGLDMFLGSPYNPKSLPKRIESVFPHCDPVPDRVFERATESLRGVGLSLAQPIVDRLLEAAKALHKRIVEQNPLSKNEVSKLQTPGLRDFLTKTGELRRVFPQRIFHWLLSEAEVGDWYSCGERGEAALFHLGALSQLVTGIETPGWTSRADFAHQIIGLCHFGAEEGRTEEQPLMVQPDCVSITTIHAAKGLEFAAVFLADVNANRFPSSRARTKTPLPFADDICQTIDTNSLADNDNNDGERRLMYVAITRAERFLFITHSSNRTSKFIKELNDLVVDSGGVRTDRPDELLQELKYSRKEHDRDMRIATSFSDLRYYLECPHDFYLRKVLGFSPAIDQAFGYGRGVHNLMRAIHSDPKKWAVLAKNENELRAEIEKLIDKGLFYLRYTTGQPAANMREKGVAIVSDYIQKYSNELEALTFEPEKEFETLIDYADGGGGALVSGAIDIIRRDDPPQVTLIDFKSGDPESDAHQKLDEREMKLQIALYALAAKKELEYEPQQGLVRYLDSEVEDKAELTIPLTENALQEARTIIEDTVKRLRDRKFNLGPEPPKDRSEKIRCVRCDFGDFCGMQEAKDYRRLRK